MRRPWMTVRRWMLLVAVAGLATGLVARRERFRSRADHHAAWAAELEPWVILGRSGRNVLAGPRITPLSQWHRAMAEKYRRAASRPWRPVAPGPPPWGIEADVRYAPRDLGPDFGTIRVPTVE